jgi:ubiquinone/menaquinone biosynthesis C-methylase UbiE
MGLYRYFTAGTPIYLARHYWWAYLWRPAAWFFDHQPIINAILFGQYHKLTQTTLAQLEHTPGKHVLQLSCAYGNLTPTLTTALSPQRLHITDVSALQLDLTRHKADTPLNVTRMNSEQLGYRDNSFTTIIIFFLLHEMPATARRHTLSECLRTLNPGGRLILTEFAPLPAQHWLYRLAPSHWLLTRLEPFLDGFWHEDITTLLNKQGQQWGKRVETVSDTRLFNNFYRVTTFNVMTG